MRRSFSSVHALRTSMAALAAAAVLAGCGPASSNGPDGSGSDAASSDAPAGPTTWYEHVAPIVYANCVNCHRDGGIAPFALVDYEQARARGPLMAAQTAARTMPPMPVNNDGSCNTFTNARWLSDAQIATIRAWVDGGMLAGDPARGPQLPAPPAGLPRVDATLDTGVTYMPSTERPDDYRCFLVDTGMTQNAFLTGYEVAPGDARVVHHVIVYQPSSASAQSQAEALDAMDATPGYTCFGGPGVAADPRVLWAPGVGATQLPATTGLPLVAGRKLVLQIHYNTSMGSFPDRTRVRLQVEPTVAREAQFQPILDVGLSLEPHLTNAEATASTPLPTGIGVTVYGVLPHMHTLGRTLHATATTGGTERCLVDVDRWDFHWQNAWWYAQPLVFRSVSAVSIRCGYDTTSRSTVTRWGEGTSDEMCLNYVYVTIP